MESIESPRIKICQSISGTIAISLDDIIPDEQNRITIPPEQVDLLVKWLLELKEKIEDDMLG